METIFSKYGIEIFIVTFSTIIQIVMAFDMLLKGKLNRKAEFWIIIIPLMVWVLIIGHLIYRLFKFIGGEMGTIYNDVKAEYNKLGQKEEKPKL